MRVRTHVSQKSPKDLEKKIKSFRAEVEKIMENSDYPLEYMYDMDETPVFKTWLRIKWLFGKGRKPCIRVRTTGSEKNCITAALCCTAAGKLLPP